MRKKKDDKRKWLKRNRVAVIGWVLAAVFLALWMARPRVKVVEKTEWKVKKVVETKVIMDSTLKADPDAKATVDKNGNVTIEGGFTLKTTRSETGKDSTTSEGHTSKTTTPSVWTGRVGASLLIPPLFKVGEFRKQLEADWNVGQINVLLWRVDIGVGGRVIFPTTTWIPELYGIGVSITF